MNKDLSKLFLECIAYEQKQDVEITSNLLSNSPLSKLVSAGYAISNLQLDNIRTGIAGRIYVELSSDRAVDQEFNTGDIKVGDIVILNPFRNKTKGDDEITVDAVVSRVSNNNVVIAVDESKDQEVIKLYSFNRFYLLKTTNTITYKRMQSTMRKLSEFESMPDNPIIQYLLYQREYLPKAPERDIKFYNENLNQSQRDAISHSLANEISIIHGPPGTGKTYTLVELIKQLYEKGERILICGPSNISVDTILERLDNVVPGDALLRIGHPSRLLPQILSHSMEVLSKTGDSGMIVKDILKEIDENISRIKKTKSSKDRREGWKEVKELRKELRQREKKSVRDLISKSRIIVTTLHGSSSRELVGFYESFPKLFDSLIIDEVSQSLEPQCWIPLISHIKSDIRKLVIAGDNKQLPPTIKTENNNLVVKTLGTTIFDRLVAHYGNSFKYLLNVQYRMHEDIMNFSSKELYQDRLIAAEYVAKRTLSDLPGVDPDDNTEIPCIWYDTQGDDFPERADEGNNNLALFSSKFNENEAYLSLYHIEGLISSNVPQEAIGIISPYSSQVSFLKRLVHAKYPRIEINTVDGFQGREKECIILSLVRSNEEFEVGFLKDERRLNVAMTRPKRQLCVIGNMETLERSKVPFLKKWVNWAEENFEIRYPDLSEFHSLYT